MSLKGSNFYLVTYFRRKRTKTLSRVEILILTILSPITTTSTKISKIAETYENFGSLSFFNMFFLDLICPEEPSSYLLNKDANNLYGHIMKHCPLPIKDFSIVEENLAYILQTDD